MKWKDTKLANTSMEMEIVCKKSTRICQHFILWGRLIDIPGYIQDGSKTYRCKPLNDIMHQIESFEQHHFKSSLHQIEALSPERKHTSTNDTVFK